MSRADRQEERKSLLIKAGAATWLARLRADDRTAEDEAAFREWLIGECRRDVGSPALVATPAWRQQSMPVQR